MGQRRRRLAAAMVGSGCLAAGVIAGGPAYGGTGDTVSAITGAAKSPTAAVAASDGGNGICIGPITTAQRRPFERLRRAFLGSSTVTSRCLFHPESFWNRALPPDAPLDRRSDRLVARLNRQVREDIAAGRGPWIATKRTSTPLYRVPADQRTVRVKLDRGNVGARRKLQRAFSEVPVPRGAKPAAGGEGHMTVWQPATDKLWDFFQARKESDGWHAGWGGAIRDVSKSPGYYTEDSWRGASHRWGATATSLPVIGGTMTLDEFAVGEVDHALAMNVHRPRERWYSWPAQRTDGTGDRKAIPEGARFRIDPNLNLDQLSMHPVTRMMAEAAQTYGIVVRDRSKATGFFAEDPSPTGTDPYRYPNGGYFRGRSPSQFLRHFPWEHLQVLKMRLCSDESQPCPPPPGEL